MPEVTSCPDCDKKLKVPDNLLGKKVKCPGCGNMFTARADGDDARPRAGVATGRVPPAKRRDDDYDDDDRDRGRRRRDEDEDDDRPRGRRDDRDRGRGRDRDDDFDDRDRERGRRWREDDYDDDDRPRRSSRSPRATASLWRGVGSGLNLWVMGAWGYLITAGVMFVVMLLMGLLVMASGSLALAGFAFFLYVLFGIAAFACAVLMIVGLGICMQAPSSPDHSTRALAIAAFCCAVGPIVLSLLFYMMVFAVMFFAFALVPAMVIINVGMPIAAIILFALFLRSCAFQAKQRDLAGQCLTWLITWLIFMGAAIALYALMFALTLALGMSGGVGGAAVGGIFVMVVGLAAAIFGLCLFIWLIRLASEVRDVVNRHASKVARADR